MNQDGWLIIGTKIDDKKFDRQVTDLQRKADKKQVDIEITSKNIEAIESEIEEAKKARDEYFKQYEELMAEQGRFRELQKKGVGSLSASEQKEYSAGFLRDFDFEVEQLDKKMKEATVGNFDKLTETLDKQKEKLKEQQYEYQKISEKIDEIKSKQERLKLNEIQGNVSNIGNSITKVVKNVARWGLAVFGVRSAYMAIRSAMNTISSQDEGLKADIDYIKNALAYTLEPIVRKVVEWMKQLVFYIGYLIKSWAGHDIFASANKNLKKSVGSAKELNKQLAGFDEMNVISDNSGGAGGGTMPSFKFEDMEVPDWLVKIKEIGEWIIANWEDVVAILLLTKLFIDILTGNWLGVIIDLVLLLIDLFFKAKDAIQVIADNWKESWQLVADFMMNKVIKPIGDWFSNLWQKIKDGVASAVQWIKDKFNSIKDFFKNIISTIVGFFKTIGTKVGDAIGGAFKKVINSVLSAVERLLNSPINQINNLLDKINAVPGINIKRLNTFSFPRLAKGGIINMPGRGVPVGSAIGGERGQEGVIPLTDSQQMALLGETIGKYININATVPVYVGNRMVAREIKRINAEDNFAYNR